MSVIQGSKHALLEDTQSAVEVGEAILRERQKAVEPAPKRVTVSVDGQTVKLAEGDTVLDAIKSIGKSVPTLCYSDRMKPFGACRTCLVEVTGRKPVAACHTPVMDGASYRTSSPLISRLRRNPSALSTPSSRVRSKTDINMVLRMPNPETKKTINKMNPDEASVILSISSVVGEATHQGMTSVGSSSLTVINSDSTRAL